jgi:hypothetical protein
MKEITMTKKHKEPKFLRYDYVEKLVKERESKLISDMWKITANQFSELTVFMVYLIWDLHVDPYIMDEYIPKIKSPRARLEAEIAFKLAKELVEEPKAHGAPEKE